MSRLVRRTEVVKVIDEIDTTPGSSRDVRARPEDPNVAIHPRFPSVNRLRPGATSNHRKTTAICTHPVQSMIMSATKEVSTIFLQCRNTLLQCGQSRPLARRLYRFTKSRAFALIPLGGSSMTTAVRLLPRGYASIVKRAEQLTAHMFYSPIRKSTVAVNA